VEPALFLILLPPLMLAQMHCLPQASSTLALIELVM
jgi:hypothetical protein